MLPLPRAPAELPLADAINLDVAKFLAIKDADGEPVGTIPSSPPAGRPSRMPTASSKEGWEVVGSTPSSPLAGGGEYLPLDRYKELGFSPELLDTWTDAKYIHPWGLCYRIFFEEETIPQEPQNVKRFPSSTKLPPPPKAAPKSMGPPPVKSPPNTKPLPPMKTEAVEYRCKRCGHHGELVLM